LAWAAFVEGNGEEMEMLMTRYFKQLPKIILQNPASAQTSFLLRCIDYRNSFVETLKGLQKLPLKRFARANTPSITQNFPFFHRSSRDYSEFLQNEEASFATFRKTFGVLFGDEYDITEKAIRAGFLYERGDLEAASEMALSAISGLQLHLAPEVQFCVYMISAAIALGQGNQADTQKALDGAAAMIERHKAYYLEANYQTFISRQKIGDGDIEAAQDWLKYNNSGSPHNQLLFFKLYRYFTTARAYIVVGDYNTAIIFLKKILALSEQYRRPLDIIETKILIAISYWKKGGGMAQNKALKLLESAIQAADEYNYIQVFINEGAEIANMLHRLQKRIAQKDYDGELSASQVKPLYILSLPRAKHSKGLTGGRARENMKFTDRQKEVMHYLCEGLTHKEIAAKMGIKFSSVKSHTILIYKKLDVSNISDAVVKIQELGLLK
jgi:LuxR family maltose regulon positive regulatory protein